MPLVDKLVLLTLSNTSNDILAVDLSETAF